MTENADQKQYWNEVVGERWVTNQMMLDRAMAPLAERLLRVASPRPGERVLDVGCGCGEIALRAAELVGPTGKVLGIDISRPMLAHASSRSQALSLAERAPIAWLEADAMVYEFEPAYDLLISRFGVMFFEDKPRAFANLRQAMKPGGRFALLAWRRRADVEWFEAPLQWIASILPPPPPTDGMVGPFGLADAEATVSMLRDAGFTEVFAESVDAALPLGATPAEAEALLRETGPAAGLIREADAARQAAARALLQDNIARIARPDGHVELGGACWIYRGAVPA